MLVVVVVLAEVVVLTVVVVLAAVVVLTVVVVSAAVVVLAAIVVLAVVVVLPTVVVFSADSSDSLLLCVSSPAVSPSFCESTGSELGSGDEDGVLLDVEEDWGVSLVLVLQAVVKAIIVDIKNNVSIFFIVVPFLSFTLYTLRLSNHFFSSASDWRLLNTLPSTSLAPGQLSFSSFTVLPNPLPPEVANRTTVFPEKS